MSPTGINPHGRFLLGVNNTSIYHVSSSATSCQYILSMSTVLNVFLYVDVLYCIIKVRHREGKLASDLVQILVGHKQPPLVLITWFFSWCGFTARNTSATHGPYSYSTTLFSSIRLTIFCIISDSWGTYLGGFKKIGGWFPVSIWN